MAPQLFLAQRKARMGGVGSSGLRMLAQARRRRRHDGQSGDGAREGETLAEGGSHPESETSGKGSTDAHSDKKRRPQLSRWGELTKQRA